jgi:hypothetical protein
MTLLPGPITVLIARELSHKYTKALAIGFVSGLILSLGFPTTAYYQTAMVYSIDRIGMVGILLRQPHCLSTIRECRAHDDEWTDARAGTGDQLDGNRQGKHSYLLYAEMQYGWEESCRRRHQYNIRNVIFSPIDQFTLRANLKAPYSAFPVVVSKPLFGNALVGFGQYRVSNIRLKGDSIVYLKLVPVGGHARHEREYRFYNTEAEAILAFKLGEVNELEDISTPGDLTNWGKSTVTTETNYNRIISVYFNITDRQLADKSVRQALAYAIPYRNDMTRAYSPISKISWAYSTIVKIYV